jgi:hypothetical protein
MPAGLRSVATFVGVVFLVVVLGSSGASALTITDADIVGAVTTRSGDSAETHAHPLAQGILDLGMGVITVADWRIWLTSFTQDYSGDLTAPGVTFDNTGSVPAGYDFALARYHGVWVLFYLDGEAADLPEFFKFLGKKKKLQIEIKNVTAFSVASVPDGGSAAALLGVALVGLGLVRQLARPKP